MRSIRTEDEIIANWKGDIENPVVSICCITYNHEPYIEDALEGFLIQETDFPFEILIHDDASTDRTSEIIREYEVKYPSLVKLISQTENQFSKGKMLNDPLFKKAKGFFLALCHGDDFWIDKTKLSKQVLVMRQFGASISGHPAKEVDVECNDLDRLTGFLVDRVSKFEPKELIQRNGNMLPYGSIMISNAVKEDMLANMPPIRFHTGLQMLGALRGGVVVLPDVMLAYRVNVPGSTTEIMLRNDDSRLSTTIKRVESIKELKKLYGEIYTSSFNILLAKQSLIFTHPRKIRPFLLVINNVLKGEMIISKMAILSMVISLNLIHVLKYIFRFKTH